MASRLARIGLDQWHCFDVSNPVLLQMYYHHNNHMTVMLWSVQALLQAVCPQIFRTKPKNNTEADSS